MNRDCNESELRLDFEIVRWVANVLCADRLRRDRHVRSAGLDWGGAGLDLRSARRVRGDLRCRRVCTSVQAIFSAGECSKMYVISGAREKVYPRS